MVQFCAASPFTLFNLHMRLVYQFLCSACVCALYWRHKTQTNRTNAFCQKYSRRYIQMPFAFACLSEAQMVCAQYEHGRLTADAHDERCHTHARSSAETSSQTSGSKTVTCIGDHEYDVYVVWGVVCECVCECVETVCHPIVRP